MTWCVGNYQYCKSTNFGPSKFAYALQRQRYSEDTCQDRHQAGGEEGAEKCGNVYQNTLQLSPTSNKQECKITSRANSWKMLKVWRIQWAWNKWTNQTKIINVQTVQTACFHEIASLASCCMPRKARMSSFVWSTDALELRRLLWVQPQFRQPWRTPRASRSKIFERILKLHKTVKARKKR